MDAQQQDEDENIVISFFPDPPPFWKHFTTANQERLQQVAKESATVIDDTKPVITRPFGASLSAEQISCLPTELRYLVPPPPPADEKEFTVFSQITRARGTDTFMMNMEHISRALVAEQVLEEWTYEPLYPSANADAPTQTNSTSTSATLDRQNYLLRFLRSIMLSYISLLGIVASNPTSPLKNEKLKDMLNMVTNMHALINEYRPHQARETLIRKMEDHVERKKSEIEGVKKMAEKVKVVLKTCGQEAEGLYKHDQGPPDEGVVVVSEEEKRVESQRRMWEAMDDLLG
jgi:mediator of RNA polymerase II transcription subunit 7